MKEKQACPRRVSGVHIRTREVPAKKGEKALIASSGLSGLVVSAPACRDPDVGEPPAGLGLDYVRSRTWNRGATTIPLTKKLLDNRLQILVI